MEAYVIIGRANARKSSVIRSLTGVDKRGIRDIAPITGIPFRTYVRVSSLQESNTTPQAFLDEVSAQDCRAVVFCMWPEARRRAADRLPDAVSYIRFFQESGWNIHRVAVLGQDSSPNLYPNARAFPRSRLDPINVTARAVRQHFDWQ